MSSKCQVQGDESFIDCMFVVFSQSYLIEQARVFQEQEGYNSRRRMKLLDIGCYNGRLAHFLAQNRIYVSYTGVDVVPEYLRNSFVKDRKHVELLCEDVTTGISVPDGSQDMVVSSEVFEHIEQERLAQAVSVIHDKLRFGGRMCVSFPMNTRSVEFHKLEREQNLGHVNFPVFEDFVAICSRTGFVFLRYDSGFTLKSSYRLPDYNSLLYRRMRDRVGSKVARAIWLIITDEHTGGGYFVFDKKS